MSIYERPLTDFDERLRDLEDVVDVEHVDDQDDAGEQSPMKRKPILRVELLDRAEDCMSEHLRETIDDFEPVGDSRVSGLKRVRACGCIYRFHVDDVVDQDVGDVLDVEIHAWGVYVRALDFPATRTIVTRTGEARDELRAFLAPTEGGYFGN